MKNLAKYLLLLLFVVAFPARADGPARWVAKDSDTTLYLYGTIHVLKSDVLWQTVGMLADFDKAGKVIFELSPDQMTPQVMQPLMFSKGMFAAGDSLANHMETEKYNELVELLASVGISSQMVAQMKPWFATIMLTQVVFTQGDYSGEIGVEKTLTARAQRNNQDISGLESAAEQLGYFADMSMEKQIEFLNISLEDMEDATHVLDDMLATWLLGDIEATAALMNEGFEELPELYDLLIVKRNKNWIEQINKHMQAPGILFMAVGAGHMPGDEGVINLLKEAGYDVQRLE